MSVLCCVFEIENISTQNTLQTAYCFSSRLILTSYLISLKGNSTGLSKYIEKGLKKGFCVYARASTEKDLPIILGPKNQFFFVPGLFQIFSSMMLNFKHNQLLYII